MAGVDLIGIAIEAMRRVSLGAVGIALRPKVTLWEVGVTGVVAIMTWRLAEQGRAPF